MSPAIGLGLGMAFTDLGGASSFAPVVWPTGDLVSAYSAVRLQGYSGPERRLSNGSSTLDVGFAGNVTDRAAADAFSTTAKVQTWYNQVQAGNDLTNPTFATMMNSTSLTDWYGMRLLTADGAPLGQAPKWLRSTGTMPVVNKQSMTVYAVFFPHKTYETSSVFEFTDAAFSTYQARVVTNSGPMSADTGSIRPGDYARMGLQVIALSASPTTCLLEVGERLKTITVATASQVLGALQIGQSLAGAGYCASGEYAGLFYCNTAHDATTIALCRNELIKKFKLQRLSDFSRTKIYNGSSLISAYQLTNNQNPPFVQGYGRGPAYGYGNVECFNLAAGGRSEQAEFALIGAGVTTCYNYAPGRSRVNLTIDPPSNDGASATFTSQADAETAADDLFGFTNTGRLPNTTIPYAQAGVALGSNVRVVVPTILNRGTFTAGNFKTFFQDRWDLRARTIAPANGWFVSDRQALPALQDPAQFVDNIHPNNAQSAIMAACDKAADDLAWAS